MQHHDNLRSSYGAIVDYHNNLVHMRFTVAGLFLAANGFLVGGLYSSSAPQPQMPWYALPILGIVLAGICWLLEIRTYHLLENLGSMGKKVEERLEIDMDCRFFSLMESQAIGPKLLVIRLRLPANNFFKRVVSHSFGLGVLYGFIGLFWVFVGLNHMGLLVPIFGMLMSVVKTVRNFIYDIVASCWYNTGNR